MKYIGSAFGGGLVGGLLALAAVYLIWPPPTGLADVTAQSIASLIGIGGVLGGFIVGALLGLRWQFGPKGHRHAFEPIRVRLWRSAGGRRMTDVSSMCKCGKTRTRERSGWWSLEELRNPQETVEQARLKAT